MYVMDTQGPHACASSTIMIERVAWVLFKFKRVLTHLVLGFDPAWSIGSSSFMCSMRNLLIKWKGGLLAIAEMSIASFGGIENDDNLQHGNSTCEPQGHIQYSTSIWKGRGRGRVWEWQRGGTPHHCAGKRPSLSNPTPNSHRPTDHPPTELINRPTGSQIAPLEVEPVFRSPHHTPSTTLASPPFPGHPRTSIPIDHRLEGLQMANNHCQALEKQTEPSQGMSSLYNVPQ